MISKPKLVRYGLVLVVIFILLQSVPNRSLGTKDAAVVSIVLFALYVVIENVFTKAAICGEKESMTNLNSPIIPNQISSNLPSVPTQTVVSTYTPSLPQMPIVQKMSSVQMPSVQMPSVQQPSVQMPSVQMPSVQMPSVQQPSVQMPSVQVEPDAMKPGECKDCVKKTVDEFGMDTYVYKTNTQKYETAPTRATAGVMPSETQYTDYNILPVTPEDSKLYEYGYSFLPPEKWFPVPPHPPVCVSEKRCPVCPVTTTGTPVDMKEWNDSRRITPGDVINIDYARDKLNSGR